jgi:hypothetical protein
LAYLLSNGEGVFEALHALFQVLDLPLLVGQEEVFDPVHPDLDSGDVLLGGCGLEAFVDYLDECRTAMTANRMLVRDSDVLQRGEPRVFVSSGRGKRARTLRGGARLSGQETHP